MRIPIVVEYTTVFVIIRRKAMPRPITGETPLARLRIAAGLSQRELAERVDTISVPGIRRWATGRTRPSVDILPRLASTLGVSIESLVQAIVQTPRREG